MRFPLIVALSLLVQPPAPPAAPPHAAEHHEFVIDNFRTESGVTLPKARIVYGTYGTLNAARDNVVLLPSHYMANHHGYEWLIGPDRALDPSKLFLVATELFGNGSSSSPSNTPEPFHGPRFPVMTIRDNVEAVRRLLADDLKVTHVRAIIGFSMGAEQAFQWAVSHPAFADRIVATSGTAKAWPHGVVRLEGQIAALTADPAFNGGDYTSPPRKGIEAYGMVWLGWLYSQEWWRREMWKTQRAGSHARAGDREPAPHVLPEQRRQRSHPAGAHLAAPRRRHDARLQRRRRARAALDHRAGALHAVGDRPLFPGRRRAVRGAVHPARLVRADSVAVGTPGRRRRKPGRSRVSQREHRPFPRRSVGIWVGTALGGRPPPTKAVG